MYTRATGSVPDSRTRIHEPSSKINLIPSSALTFATRRPATEDGGVRFFSASRARASADSSQVDPAREKRPDLLPQLRPELPEGLSGRADELGGEQVRQDPVLLGDVALDGQPRALLSAEDDLPVEQQLADVLEPDRRLVERHARTFGDGVEGVRRRHAAGDAAAPPLRPTRSAARSDRISLGCTYAPVSSQMPKRSASPSQARPSREPVRRISSASSRELRLAALGRPAAEERVGIGVEPRKSRSRLLQVGVEKSRRRPEPEVERESGGAAADVAAGDLRLQIEQVRRRGIEAPHGVLRRSGLLGNREDLALDLPGDLGKGRRAIGGGELDAEVPGRIVACGKVDRAGGVAPPDFEGENGRGDRPGADLGREAVADAEPGRPPPRTGRRGSACHTRPARGRRSGPRRPEPAQSPRRPAARWGR